MSSFVGENGPELIAFCCAVCDSPDPTWRIVRRGDAVVSWACQDDLSTVCFGLQRDWEKTQLIVTTATITIIPAGKS